MSSKKLKQVECKHNSVRLNSIRLSHITITNHLVTPNYISLQFFNTLSIKKQKTKTPICVLHACFDNGTIIMGYQEKVYSVINSLHNSLKNTHYLSSNIGASLAHNIASCWLLFLLIIFKALKYRPLMATYCCLGRLL